MTRGLSLVAVAAALAVLGIAFFWYGLRPAPNVTQVPIADTEALPPPAFSFTAAEQVRAMPALQFTDAEGRELSLADFRGRVILLNIWATWCVPCRREMPTLDRLQTKLSSADFEVLALSIDRQGLAAIKPFFAEVGIKALRIYVDQSGKAARTLDIVGLPTTLLIDRMGRERGRLAGPAAWDGAGSIETIRRYLSESPNLSGDGSRVTPSRAAGGPYATAIQRMTES